MDALGEVFSGVNIADDYALVCNRDRDNFYAIHHKYSFKGASADLHLRQTMSFSERN
jgi:hypothetical protein